MSGEQGVPAKYRALPLGGSLTATFTPRADGSVVVTSTEALQPYPLRLTDSFLHWADVAPERTLVAKRVDGGDWRRVSYGEALVAARSIAQALIDRGVSVDRPVAILSDNDIEHLLLGLGAMLAGVPFCPVSAAYSLLSQDHGKLRHILGVLTPGLVFASNGAAFARAIEAVVPKETPVVLTAGHIAGRPTTSFADLLATEPSDAVDAAHAKVGPDTIAKFLFTSGSTKLPKGVVNTQRMLCSNQQMILQCFPQLAEEPPVLVDWLPWNHTFGGNHNVGIALYNGGSFYIDDGKPTTSGIGETLRNLREIAPTVYFNVPKGFEEIAAALEDDERLRANLFNRVNAFMYAGAGLSQSVWDRLHREAERTVGERVRMITSLGMTETSPACTFATGTDVQAGWIGLPAPGVEVKLMPLGEGKTEIRFRGPNVMPGYYNRPADTDASFCDGWFLTGDLGRMEPDGRFVIVDRKKDMIISGGFNVYPRAIEDAIHEHPDVQEAAVIGVPDEYRGQAAKAFVVLRPGAGVLTLDALQHFLRDRLGRHEMPVMLELRDALPRTPVGKLAKRELV